MIGFQEAIKQIVVCARPLGTESVQLNEALSRVLAEDVVYDINMPPFNKSAMDGYACAKADLYEELTLVDTIYAGKNEVPSLKQKQCVKIMTGAPIPLGADMVFMQEDALVTSDGKVVCQNKDSKENVCYLGEDIKKGEVVVAQNTKLQARHLPLLAGAGYDQVKVFIQPKINIITTGTELVEPKETPQSHQIRNSNASQIIAQLNELGIPHNYQGIIEDDEDSLKTKIKESLLQSNVLVMSGGVSVGEFDLVPDILNDLGFTIPIDKTAIQPGKPMVFAHGNGKYIFGLSGNPVASFIQFELYVKPFLFALQGSVYKPLRFQLPISTSFKRKKSVRHMFVPAQILDSNEIKPLKFNGSANIGALAYADCLMEVPIGVDRIEENTMVYIRPL